MRSQWLPCGNEVLAQFLPDRLHFQRYLRNRNYDYGMKLTPTFIYVFGTPFLSVMGLEPIEGAGSNSKRRWRCEDRWPAC